MFIRFCLAGGFFSAFTGKGNSLLGGSSSSSSSKAPELKSVKNFNPWADPNFIPPNMRAKSESSPAVFQPQTPQKPTRSALTTPWADPSFKPKKMEVQQEAPKAKAEVAKSGKREDDAALAQAIAMSLEESGSTRPSEQEQNDPSLVEKIDQTLLNELLDMGFGRVRAEKSLILSKGKSLEDATNWLVEHENDADIDEPLTIVTNANTKGAPLGHKPGEVYDDEDDGLTSAMRSLREKAAKQKEEVHKQAAGGQESIDMSSMSKEEKLAYFERLKAARKAQREQEERQSAKEREIERIAATKAALDAKRTREEQQLALAAARAKREKDADRERRRRIEEKLKQDKEARIKAKLEREAKNAAPATSSK